MTSDDYDYLTAAIEIVCFLVPAYELIIKKTEDKGLKKISKFGWVCFTIAVVWGVVAFLSVGKEKKIKPMTVITTIVYLLQIRMRL